MARKTVWALMAAFVLAISGSAAAATHGSGRWSGHVPPPSAIKHPPLPPSVVKALTRKHLKVNNKSAAAVTHTTVHRGTARRATVHNTQLTAGGLVAAMQGSGFAGDLSAGASFVTIPSTGTPDASETDPAPGFPLDGPSYAVMSSGDASKALDLYNPASTGTDDSCAPGAGCGPDGDPTTKGANRQNAHDVTILKIPFTVAKTGVGSGNCLSLDFRFLSQEYTSFTFSPYDDAFVAELDKNTWTATGANPNSPISAPANFATDASGKPISISATASDELALSYATATTYPAATPILRAQTPVTAGAHTLYLSIFDQRDHAYDSTAFIDDLSLRTAPSGQCSAGAVVDETPADLSVTAQGTLGTSTEDYAVTVHNDGPAAAENVTFTDTLIFGVDYQSSDGATCTSDDDCVTCDLGELAAGQTKRLTIDTTLRDASYDFGTEAQVGSTTYDPNLGNNAMSTYDNLPEPNPTTTSDFSIASSATDTAQGTVVTIPVTITNNGPDDWTGSLFTDTYVSSSLDFIGYTTPDDEVIPDGFDGCFAVVDSDMSCGYEDGFQLANGASFEVDLLAYVTRSGWITTDSSVYPNEYEANTSNDTSLTSFEAAPSANQVSDVSLTVTPSSDFAAPGSALTYTVKVANAGPAEAKTVEVNDNEPDDVTGTSVSDTLGQCTSLTVGGFDCDVDLKPGKTDTITYKTTVADDAPSGDFIFNPVSAEPDTYLDPQPSSNYWYAYTEVAAAPAEKADLVAKLTNPTQSAVGTPITTVGSLTNKGPSAITDGFVEFESWDLPQAYMVSDPGCAWDDFGDLVCEVGPVAKGATKTAKITWVPTFGDFSFMSVYVYSTDLTWEDPNTDNQSAQTQMEIDAPSADVGIGILDGTDPILAGSKETYTITVSNAGSDPATGVQVVDTLPTNATLVSATGKNWTCTTTASITCTLKGPLAPSATSTLTLVVTFASSGDEVDTATVVSALYDSDPTNNSASVTTHVTPPTARTH